jgi:hypothetical protein
MQLFLIQLITYLDGKDSERLSKYLLLLYNISSLKTLETLKLLQFNKVPVRFSAPAYFLAIPIEGVFRAIKSCEFRRQTISKQSLLLKMPHKSPTKRQVLLYQVAHFILKLYTNKINIIFHDRL